MHDLTYHISEELSKGPKTPHEVAKTLGISWSTARGHLLRLAREDKVSLVRKGRATVFHLRASRVLRFNVPTWVRARTLRELSSDLEEYLPKKPTAAETARIRRGKY